MTTKEGLTMASTNPFQKLLINTALASGLLINKTNATTCYIKRMNAYHDKKATEIKLSFSSGRNPHLKGMN